jgi:hypothetical protein
MSLFPEDQMPPTGEKVKWEVQVPGRVTWTLEVECVTPEEAVAIAIGRLENDVDIKPDDEAEPDMEDAEVMGWSDIEAKPEAA